MSCRRALRLLLGLISVLPLAAVGQAVNPVPFLNLPFIPASVTSSSPSFTLTVNGGNFVPSSVVTWNGQGLATTYVSVTRLTAIVPASDVAVSGTANVTVYNPAPGGGASISVLLPVSMPTSSQSFEQLPVTTGNSPISLAVADFNGDGKADIAYINAGTGTSSSTLVSIQLGKGDGTFTQGSTIEVQQDTVPFGGYILTGDFNGDGKIDLAFSSSPNGDPTIFAIALGNGDGTFQTPAYASANEAGFEFVTGDFNRDGKLDLANLDLSESESLIVFLGNGDGTLTGEGTFIGCCGGNLSTGDFNADGILDLAAGENILIGDGNGSFTIPTNLNPAFEYPPLVGDFNGDGIPDLIFPASPVSVLLGNGDGTFTQKTQSQEINSVFLVAADFNGDGKLDLASIDGSSAMVSLLLGNGDGTFQTSLNYPVAAAPSSLALGDFNNDGHLDLALTDSNDAVSILLYTANAAQTSTTVQLLSSLNPSAYGQSVTFSAKVIHRGSSAPTGTVAFMDGSTNLGKPTLNSKGVATLSISTLLVGAHAITAAYSGDVNFLASNSSTLSQVVQGAIAVISPMTLNFGNQTVGVNSAAQSVTLTNTGNIPLTIINIYISLSNGSYTQANTCGTSLAAGASCMFSLSWMPGASGNMTGCITFTDNDPNGPQKISVTGTGILPVVNLFPTHISFPAQVVSTSSKAILVTLTNSGAGILNITNISATGPFAQTNTCGTSVATGASCTFSVTFKPIKIGTQMGGIFITDNASDSPQQMSLAGVGTYIQVSSTSMSFGNQAVGTKSLPKKITVSNQGNVAVSITGISIAGTNGGDFSQSNTCGNNIAPGASCSIAVTFTPSATGSRLATVNVNDNGGGTPQKVELAGSGT